MGLFLTNRERRTEKGRQREEDRERRTERGGQKEQDRERRAERGGQLEVEILKRPGDNPIQHTVQRLQL